MQYWFNTACSWPAPATAVIANKAATVTALFILRHQFLDQRHRARLFFRHVRREVDTLGPSQRIAPLLVLHVEARAIPNQQLNNIVEAAIRRAHHSREP